MHTDSPEERLLRLIRKKDKRGAEHKKSQEKISSISSLGEAIFLKSKIFKPNHLRRLNGFLAILLASISVYLLYRLVFFKPGDIDSLLNRVEPSKAIIAETEADVMPAKLEDYPHYSKEIGSKELFGPSVIVGDDKGIKDADLRKRFALVGILPGARPQAIIEDKEAQKTHYLFKGDAFNGFTVAEVESGKVILDYEGKKIELIL